MMTGAAIFGLIVLTLFLVVIVGISYIVGAFIGRAYRAMFGGRLE